MIKPQQKRRLRVFAGPNGSGKSTVIQYVRSVSIKKRPINFGYYINADDVAGQLRGNEFTFDAYGLNIKPKEFIEVALHSGLINDNFSAVDLQPLLRYAAIGCV